MPPLRITAVSYLNTFPFVYGIRESGYLTDYCLDLAIPSVCAGRLQSGEADVALIPVGALPQLEPVIRITDFCIGAVGNVKTVALFSHKPLSQIRRISLDFDSRTSVELVRILAARFWHIEPEFVQLPAGMADGTTDHEAVVAIGDKTFDMYSRYPYVTDLAGAWHQFTGLPFVFAIWATRKKIDENILGAFSDALAFGVERKAASLAYFSDMLPPCNDCLEYLEKNISFTLDEEKRKGLARFLEYLK